MVAGLSVIFFAGLSWKLVLPPSSSGSWRRRFWSSSRGNCALTTCVGRSCTTTSGSASAPCGPGKDPLGKGFHIIQGMIAIGSGGVFGKGFMQGTQTHLEFIPERTTDFIFAAFSEEFGLVGNLCLIAGFLFLVLRGLAIALEASTVFSRLLAGAITMIFFTYAFVNMGMVSGILAVVGVPLPFISYGGTAMATLGIGLGMLMSIYKAKRLVQVGRIAPPGRPEARSLPRGTAQRPGRRRGDPDSVAIVGVATWAARSRAPAGPALAGSVFDIDAAKVAALQALARDRPCQRGHGGDGVGVLVVAVVGRRPGRGCPVRPASRGAGDAGGSGRAACARRSRPATSRFRPRLGGAGLSVDRRAHVRGPAHAGTPPWA